MTSRDIKDCVQELQDKWPLLEQEFERRFPGWNLILTCTHRSPEEQFELYKKGRRQVGDDWAIADAGQVVTYKDGLKSKSEHNVYPARAFDVAIKKPDGSLTWDLKEQAWQELPLMVKELKLVSGGSWVRFKDFPHVEVSKEGWV